MLALNYANIRVSKISIIKRKNKIITYESHQEIYGHQTCSILRMFTNKQTKLQANPQLKCCFCFKCNFVNDPMALISISQVLE